MEEQDGIAAALREKGLDLPPGTISRAELLDAIEQRRQMQAQLRKPRGWRFRANQAALIVGIAYFTYRTLDVWGVLDVWLYR